MSKCKSSARTSSARTTMHLSPINRSRLVWWKRLLGRWTLAPEHPDLAASLRSVGYLHFLRVRDKSSLLLLQEALAMRQQLLGGQHPLTAETLFHLGLVRIRKYQFVEARKLFEGS